MKRPSYSKKISLQTHFSRVLANIQLLSCITFNQFSRISDWKISIDIFGYEARFEASNSLCNSS